MINDIPDALGVIGVVLLLTGFFLLNTNKLTALHVRYQLLNFIGSALVLCSLYFRWNTPSALIETAWIIISTVGLYRAWRYRQRELT